MGTKCNYILAYSDFRINPVIHTLYGELLRISSTDKLDFRPAGVGSTAFLLTEIVQNNYWEVW